MDKKDVEKTVIDLAFLQEKLGNGIFSDRIKCIEVAIKAIQENAKLISDLDRVSEVNGNLVRQNTSLNAQNTTLRAENEQLKGTSLESGLPKWIDEKPMSEYEFGALGKGYEIGWNSCVSSMSKLKTSTKLDIKGLEAIMIAHGVTLRAIPKKIKSIVECCHARSYPNGTIQYLEEFKRDMLITERTPKNAGKFILESNCGTNCTVEFHNNEFFDSIEQAAESLQNLPKEQEGEKDGI